MIGTLKCPYPGLTTEITSDILTQIQTSIRQKVKIRLDLKSFSASFNEQITQITRVYFNSGQRNVGAEPV